MIVLTYPLLYVRGNQMSRCSVRGRGVCTDWLIILLWMSKICLACESIGKWYILTEKRFWCGTSHTFIPYLSPLPKQQGREQF